MIIHFHLIYFVHNHLYQVKINYYFMFFLYVLNSISNQVVINNYNFYIHIIIYFLIQTYHFISFFVIISHVILGQSPN